MTIMAISLDRASVAGAAPALRALAPWVAWHENARYFELPPGQEHYCLLAYLARAVAPLPGRVLDVGTYLGYSAVACAADPGRDVLSFDVVDRPPPKLPERVQLVVADITSGCWDADIRASPLAVLDVDPHDGQQEVAIFRHLEQAGFRGLLVCDDIHLNPGMRSFWASIPHAYKKVDATALGHVTGTGIVVFDPAYVTVEVDTALF